MDAILLARRTGMMAGLLLAVVFVFWSSEMRGWLAPSTQQGRLEDTEREDMRDLDRTIADATRRLAAMVPRRPFLVVSATDNSFELVRRGQVVRRGLCSTGSYVQLKGHEGREWLFETPRGGFRILQKRTNPVWVKPDWAFVEAGEPIPPPGSPLRHERGVLGRYALAIGDGYLIHGTLYQRLLGRPVTHGCVRLGDEDLEVVYQTLSIGDRVYIY